MPFGKPVLYRGWQKVKGIPVCFNKVWLHDPSNIQVLDIASETYSKNKKNTTKTGYFCNYFSRLFVANLGSNIIESWTESPTDS